MQDEVQVVSRGKGRAHLRIVPRDKRWREDLWIDEKRMLVVKSVVRRPRSVLQTGEIKIETVWQECRVNKPVDATLFTFRPPAEARRMNTLEHR